MEVYALKNRKPKYFVMDKDKILFENDDAAKVFQYAIDNI